MSLCYSSFYPTVVWPLIVKPCIRIEFRRFVHVEYSLYDNTVEPLNKGHLRTEGIVPYSEVVPYWEVLQKK